MISIRNDIFEEIREHAQSITQKSKSVKYHIERIDDFAQKIHESMKRNGYSSANWHQHSLNPSSLTVETVKWIFTVDLLNFSFWSPTESDGDAFQVTWEGKAYTGYWSLCAAINRAISEGIPIFDVEWLSTVSTKDLSRIFRPDPGHQPTPMLQQRLQLLQESALVIKERFAGCISNLLKEADHSAAKLIAILTATFPSFMDISWHPEGGSAIFLKRAQIFVADLWACFDGVGWGHFNDIDQITIFADYRIPQILQFMNLISIDNVRYQSGYLFSVHDPFVVELRACSIWICDLLLEAIKSLSSHHRVNSILLDFYLWDTCKELLNGEDKDAINSIPIHKTRSVYY